MSECNVIFYPWNKEIKVKQGTTLLEASQMAGITISDLCGGEGICGRCKMIVKEGRVSGKISGKLTRDEIRNGFVLACLTFVKSDLVIEIPRDVFAKEKRDVGEEMNRFREFENILYKKEYQQSPLVQKIYLNLDKPSLSNNIPDHQRICAAVKKKLNVSSTQTGLKIIKSIPKILRDNNYCITATVGIRADIAEMMYVEGGNTEDKNYLIAIDIGTTTIVAHLLDANAFKTLDAEACFNSQSIYGAEVTSRMISAEKKGIEVLQKLLVDDINNMIKSLAKKNEINFKDITAVVCAGNTAMGHFLLGLPICNILWCPKI